MVKSFGCRMEGWGKIRTPFFVCIFDGQRSGANIFIATGKHDLHYHSEWFFRASDLRAVPDRSVALPEVEEKIL